MKDAIITKLSEWAQKIPEKNVLILPEYTKKKTIKNATFTSYSYAYGYLEEKSNKLASALVSIGIKKGDNVLLFVPLSLELYLCIFALMKIGAVAVFIELSMPLKQIKQCCAWTRPKAVIGIRKSWIYNVISRDFRSIPIHLYCNPYDNKHSLLSLDKLMLSGSSEFAIPNHTKDCPALLTFTSGSSGMPKGVLRTMGFLHEQHKVVSDTMTYEEGEMELTSLPIFVLNNIANNVASVLPAIPKMQLCYTNPKLLQKQIDTFPINRALGSPYIFEQLIELGITNNLSFPSINKIYTGGAPISTQALIQASHVFPNASIHIVYGSTEAEPIAHISVATLNQKYMQQIIQGQGLCVGNPIKNIKLAIIKPTKNPISFVQTEKQECLVNPGTIGEIIVSGNHVNKTYFNNKHAELQYKIQESNGISWHRTGDCGYVDQEGNVWLVGSLGSVIEVGDSLFYQQNIEQMLQKLPFIQRTACIMDCKSIKNIKGHLVCYVLLKHHYRSHSRTEKKNLKQQIIEYANKRAIPIHTVIFKNSFPMDRRHHGKIEYSTFMKRK